MELKKILTIISFTLYASSAIFAYDKPIATMKSNSQINYFKSPLETDSISGMFKDGMFYGRLRSNSFYFWWNEEDSAHDIHLFTGLGGSLVYKSATLNRFNWRCTLLFLCCF